MTLTPIDYTLGAGVLALVLLTVTTRGRRAAAMSFLGLGVLMSLVWLRLGSIDVGLAEAALGTGLMSALLVTLSLRIPTGPHPDTGARPALPRAVQIGVGALGGGLLVLVLAVAWSRARSVLPAWEAELAEAMPTTGVTHDVTGVLLGFRAYDTLLESAVLMLAGVLVLSVSRDGSAFLPDATQLTVPTTLSWTARVMAPLLILLGLWLLFAGSSSPGGAFQSGAVLAATLVLLRTARIPLARLERRWLLRALVIGVIVFTLAAVIGPVTGGAWLAWPEPIVFGVVLTVEVLLTIGIAAGLYLIYLGLSDPAEAHA